MPIIPTHTHTISKWRTGQRRRPFPSLSLVTTPDLCRIFAKKTTFFFFDPYASFTGERRDTVKES